MEVTLVERIEYSIKAARVARLKAAAGVASAQSIAFKATGVSELGIIYGIGGSAGSAAKLDKDREFLEKSGLCKIAFDFCGGKRSFKANHQESLECELVESWVAAPIIKDGTVERTLKADEIFDPATYTGRFDKNELSHWFVGVRPFDPAIVELAKKGEIAGFSWGALVSKERVA